MRTPNQHSYFKVSCNGVENIVYASSAAKARELGAQMEVTVEPASPDDIQFHLANGGGIIKQPASTGAKRGPKPGSMRTRPAVSAEPLAA